MTNKDKFLKESASVEEFANEIGTLISNGYNAGVNRKVFWCVNEVEKWLEKQTTLTLTEDERVILRNIDLSNFSKIGKDKYGTLYLKGEPCYGFDNGKDKDIFHYLYHDLFQFIENGEEYEIKKLLGDEE